MQVINFITWLQATITCPTIYSNLGIDKSNANDKALLVKSVEPWMLLKLYANPLPSNCAILLLDSMDDFLESIPIVKKSRVRVTYVLRLAKNSSELHSKSWPPMHNEVHIVQLNKDGQVKGRQYTKLNNLIHAFIFTQNSLEHQFLTPYTKNGLSRNRHVRISYTILYPYVYEWGNNPKGSDIDLIQALSKSLGFTYEYKYDKYFQGLIRNVWSGEADFCISHPAVALHRYAFGLDVMALSARNYVLVQRHPTNINSVYTIVQPFNMYVWLALLFTIISIYITLAFLNR